MSKLWAKLVHKQRIQKSDTVECMYEDSKDALIDLCKAFDIAAPIWLNKQMKEFEKFHRTEFRKDNFLEAIAFDSLVVEYIDENASTRTNQDPRNQFED